jgi:hypothetical protein
MGKVKIHFLGLKNLKMSLNRFKMALNRPLNSLQYKKSTQKLEIKISQKTADPRRGEIFKLIPRPPLAGF